MRDERGTVVVGAPLEGWCTPLDELPDPVFAGRMLGDGVAIDPLGSTVFAPCDGEVIALPVSRHAVTLRAVNGAEILIHVGIDTVGLHGEGFEALVRVGDTVRAGTPLLRFDLDSLAQRAKSVLSPVIVINEGYSISALAADRAVNPGDALFAIARRDRAITGAAHAGSGAVVTRPVVLALAHGLHARPAGRIAQVARSTDARVRLVAGAREADARSVTSLMMLGLRSGEQLAIQAEGADAEGIADAIASILAGDDERVAPAADAAASIVSQSELAATESIDGLIRGVIASRGLALGTVHHLRAATFVVAEHGAGIEHERTALARAVDAVRAKLHQASNALDAMQRDVAAAHAMLLDDPELTGIADRAIDAGRSAGHAWREAVRRQSAALEQLDDAYLRERAADLRDLEAQVLTALGAATEGSVDTALPADAIVVAREILPSQFAALDPSRLAGLCTSGGGPTSHVAILAGSIGVPMLVAAGPAVESLLEGQTVLLDANAGLLHVEPNADVRADAERRIANDRERRAQQRAVAQRPACTTDGHRILVYANLGSPDDATQAVALGAEGCGLLRSEFLFLERRTAPTEDEQFAVYQDIASRLDGRTLTIRTLDVGGDKPLEYLPMPGEDNPALGLRGVRTSLYRRDLLREQLRAILRVQPAQQCRILLPMVTDLGEVEAVRAELALAVRDLGLVETPALGVMIETPAAAVLADTLARHVDFLSVGTNDLTQYTLAMDRTHPQLAARLDGLHPAVLRLIAAVCTAAHAHVREVAVCGSLAMDEAAIPLLLGLGVQELSVAHAAVPAVKARIATLELEACRALAQRALALATSAEVRALTVRTDPSSATAATATVTTP